LSGKEFQVLKTKKIAGGIILVLQEHQCGSFGILAEWTDYFTSDHEVSPTSDVFISVESLLALCELIEKISKECIK
jgi:hypothetical protein